LTVGSAVVSHPQINENPSEEQTSMTLTKISVALLLSLGVASSGLSARQADAKTPKTTSHHTLPSSPAGDEAAIRAQLSSLSKELENGDAVGLGFLWTIDGTYIDDGGQETKGRPDLIKRFLSLFKDNGKMLFDLVPENIRLLSNNVGYCEGTVKRKEGQKAVPETRFSMVFVKQDGNWLISSATETPIVSEEPTAHETLTDLSWLLGSWKAERDGGSVRLNADWTPNKNFIRCEYAVSKPNQLPTIDIQIIGWDPRKRQIVSWSFDSSGGFGSASWYRENSKWVVDSTAVERDGSTSRAINVLEPTGTNGFTWQSVNRSVDGIALGETAPLKVERVNQ
jgi:ketosteroid isomerase-like protein